MTLAFKTRSPAALALSGTAMSMYFSTGMPVYDGSLCTNFICKGTQYHDRVYNIVSTVVSRSGNGYQRKGRACQRSLG